MADEARNIAPFCLCGCGKRTHTAAKRSHGYQPGEFVEYLPGHSSARRYYRDVRTRLINKREIIGDCWIWRGQIDKQGYGRMSVNNRKKFVHNLSYRLFKGNIPKGFEPDHLCKVHACFNPAHLEAVTQAENVRRSSQAKLTHADVKLIRALSEPHTVTAKRYGVHPSTICDIRNFRHWNYEGRSS